VSAILSPWLVCVDRLKSEFSFEDISTFILPLQSELKGTTLFLYAPNRHIVEHVRKHFLERIESYFSDIEEQAIAVKIKVGNPSDKAAETPHVSSPKKSSAKKRAHNLNPLFTFEKFVEGKSNQLAKAACIQVASGDAKTKSYNPLFIYGGVGLGKTHLMHAIGNHLLEKNPDANVLYVHSERFVADMVQALQKNEIQEFKNFYRSLDLLLIDDIQFFSGKDRTQEEFFHTFNVLLEGNRQIVMTSDRYPKEIEGVEERLKSRFGSGLTVAVEPPDMETRAAILMNKASTAGIDFPSDIALFIAKHLRSNVRELEGALKRIVASLHVSDESITLPFVKDILRDLLSVQSKLISIDNIQKTVAHYYKIKIADLLSKRRTKSSVVPRHMAIALAKELTSSSLVEIGEQFGGRDHTTVIHAHRKVMEEIKTDLALERDYLHLMRLLSS
jgi:chromosomal replication initiator protein